MYIVYYNLFVSELCIIIYWMLENNLICMKNCIWRCDGDNVFHIFGGLKFELQRKRYDENSLNAKIIYVC